MPKHKKTFHLILGLFSDDPGQIMASRTRLEADGWLRQEVSTVANLISILWKESVFMPLRIAESSQVRADGMILS